MSKVAGGSCRCKWQRREEEEEEEEGSLRRKIQDEEVIATLNININNENIAMTAIASSLTKQRQQECHTTDSTTKSSIEEDIINSRHVVYCYNNNDMVNNNDDDLFELTLDIGKTTYKSMDYSRDHDNYPLDYYRTFSIKFFIENFTKWFTFIIKNNNDNNATQN